MSSRLKPISAIVIDDEFLNRELVVLLIRRFKESFNITGTASNVKEGLQLINETRPDVVFLDIKMPDGSGFDLLKKVEEIDFEIVFVSGFDSYALKAFEFNAIDYVLKPIDLDKFKDTLERIEKRLRSDLKKPNRKILESFGPSQNVITKIPIHYKDEVLLIDLKEVLYFKAIEGNTVILKSPSDRFVSSKQLSEFEFILEKFANFVKVNRSTYVNVNYISKYSKGSECVITMTNNECLEVSRRKKNEILSSLDRTIPGRASI